MRHDRRGPRPLPRQTVPGERRSFFDGLAAVKKEGVIVLDDTLTHQSQIFYRTVGKASNDLHLTWDPQPGSLPPLRPAGGTMLKTEGFTFTTSVRSQGWKLYQNYPNPFN